MLVIDIFLYKIFMMVFMLNVLFICLVVQGLLDIIGYLNIGKMGDDLVGVLKKMVDLVVIENVVVLKNISVSVVEENVMVLKKLVIIDIDDVVFLVD